MGCLHPGLQNHLKPMKTNKYHKYHSLAAMQLSQRLWGSGGRAPSTTPYLHPDLQNHLKPLKTMQRHINVPNVREGSAAERKPVNPPVTSGNQACLEGILPISINLWKRGGLPPPSPSGSRRTLSPDPRILSSDAPPDFLIFALGPCWYSILCKKKVVRNQHFGSKTTTEFFDFCSRSQLILLFSLFRFFGRAREERSIFKRSKNENVVISLDRVQFHLPKTTKREPPETRFLPKKGRFSKRLQNGIVKISWGFPSKSPHGFTKNGLERVPENAPARARSGGRPEGPHIENVTISLYRVKIHLQKS